MSVRGTSNSNSRGSAEDRRRRKLWLLAEFGNGQSAPCAFCGAPLNLDTITVDRHPIPGCDGGTYARDNIRPACASCNSRDGCHLRDARKAAA